MRKSSTDQTVPTAHDRSNHRSKSNSESGNNRDGYNEHRVTAVTAASSSTTAAAETPTTTVIGGATHLALPTTNDDGDDHDSKFNDNICANTSNIGNISNHSSNNNKDDDNNSINNTTTTVLATAQNENPTVAQMDSA